MIDAEQAAGLTGSTVLGADDAPIGTVTEVIVDQNSGMPGWITVTTGPGRNALVPLHSATSTGAGVVVPFAHAVVAGAPAHRAGQPLTPGEAAALEQYYATASLPVNTGAAAVQPDGEIVLIRSEEQLHVDTVPAVYKRVRIQKVVVTEMQTITVPVRREELRITEEEITTEENVGQGADLAPVGSENLGAETPLVIVLHQEKVSVDTTVVPVEMVRIRVDTVQSTQQVNAAVRQERIEQDGAGTNPERLG